MNSLFGGATNFYEAVGGAEVIDRLAHDFYRGVATDEVLLAQYVGDLAEAEQRFARYLRAYLGGPGPEEGTAGPPLGRSHRDFRIGIRERDRWLFHMGTAIDGLDLPEDLDLLLRDYMIRTAHNMVNDGSESLPPSPRHALRLVAGGTLISH